MTVLSYKKKAYYMPSDKLKKIKEKLIPLFKEVNMLGNKYWKS